MIPDSSRFEIGDVVIESEDGNFTALSCYTVRIEYTPTIAKGLYLARTVDDDHRRYYCAHEMRLLTSSEIARFMAT